MQELLIIILSGKHGRQNWLLLEKQINLCTNFTILTMKLQLKVVQCIVFLTIANEF